MGYNPGMLSFEKRTVLVTGAARGIGKAIARRFHEEGATVLGVDLDQEAIDRACDEIAPDGLRIAGLACDVSDLAAVETLFRQVRERFGALDVLVNNAGITRDNLFARMTFDEWRRVLDVNLTGTFLCSKHALPLLRKSPHGRIVNMASIAAGGNLGQANYSASKAGVIGLTKTLAIELARYGVTVNAVAPGFIDTEMTRGVPEKFRQHWIARVPMARAGTADDVAGAVLFFASDEASYVTGDVIDVDGGLHTPESVSASIDRVTD